MVHLSKPGPDTGVFTTEEVRPRTKPCRVTSRVIAFPKDNYTSPPNVAAGIKSLDLSHLAPVRANLIGSDITSSTFKIAFETWGPDSKLYAASATWIEHKAAAKDCHFGQFDTRDVNPADAPQQETALEFSFPKPFREAPQVICWLNRLDMESGEDYNYRLSAYASGVSKDGFTAHLDAWGDCQLNGAAMCWIAFPRNKRKVASGTFSTSDVRPWHNPRPKNSARVRFPQGKFAGPPTVLVALNMLDLAGNADLRVKVEVSDVDQEGFTWHLDTWDDSTMYAAGASWIALGFE